MNDDNTASPPRTATRSTARLAAVQALYQMDMAGAGVRAVIQEFAAHRFGHDLEGEHYREADFVFFEDLLSGMVREQAGVDRAIAGHLAEGWKLSRIDATLRAILRAGAYELMHRPDVPVKVIINEYVEVAHAFFEGGDEPPVVNGVLDKMARSVRAGEMPGRSGDGQGR